MQNAKSIILLILSVVLLNSCDTPATRIDSENPVKLSMNLLLPDYQNRNVTIGSGSASRFISPETTRIEVTITAADIIVPITTTVNVPVDVIQDVTSIPDVYADFRMKNEDLYDYCDLSYNGFGWAKVQMTDIPPGFDRSFEVKTFDGDNNQLTQGTADFDIHINVENNIFIWMHPTGPTELILDTAVSSSVENGSLKFFKIDTSTMTGFLEFDLTSSGDLDLYLFDNNATKPNGANNFWIAGSPTSEKAYIDAGPEDFVYAGVYGYEDSTLPIDFTIKVSAYSGTNIPLTAAIATQVPGTYTSIWNDPAATNVFDSQVVITGEYRPINIPFDFSFLGLTHSTVYIASNGYISFWPYGSFNRITKYTDDFPSYFISLYGTSYDIWDPMTQGVVYKIEGTSPNRQLIIEYYNLEDDKLSEMRLFGQIVLNESDNSVELLYDRTNSTMAWDGFTGLVNQDWTGKLTPAESPSGDGWFPAVPNDDYILTDF